MRSSYVDVPRDMHAALDRPLALWRRTPRWVRAAAVSLLCVAGAWAVALATLNLPATRARIRAAVVEAVARRLPGARIGDAVTVDPLFRVSFGPLVVDAERKGAPPTVRADRVKVRPAWLALLRGRVQPATVRLYGVRIEAGERFGDLRALAERLERRGRRDPRGASEPDVDAGGAPAPSRDWPVIHLRGLVIALRHAGDPVEIGPIDVTVSRRRDGPRDDAELSVVLRGGGRLGAALHREGAVYRLHANAADVGPDALPATFAGAAIRWSAGSVSGDLELAGEAGGPAKGRVRVRLDRAAIAGERLDPAPVGPVSATLEAELLADPVERRLALRHGALQLLGAIDADLDAEVRVGPGFPGTVALSVAAIDFAALETALPPALRPPREAPHPAGPLSFRLALSGPLGEPSAWAVDADLDLSQLREAGRRAPPVALRSTFTWTPEVERGKAPTIVVGPSNPAFVPIGTLPEHVVRAVTTSEDGGFFGHPGFDFQELRNAFAQGAEAGRVVRGASTITQQLAKNLYLSREKTLSRKAREAMVAIALEATVPKARLLEIYLNIAEWGPGIWGIGPAAEHYFGKPAAALTAREAAFLASIIPNPVRFHYYYTRGELDDAWNERLRVILLHMTEAGVLTEDQLLEALGEPLHFTSRTAALDAVAPEAAPADPPEPAAEAAPAARDPRE